MQVAVVVVVTTVQLAVHKVFQVEAALVAVVKVQDMDHMMDIVAKQILAEVAEVLVEETALIHHLVETVAVA